MSKLTPEQKEQNKIRAAARDAAFRARKKDFEAVMKKAQDSLENTPQYKAMTLANDSLVLAMEKLNQREDELRAQIRAIEAELSNLRKTMSIDRLDAHRKDATKSYFDLKASTLAAVDAQFPDVCRVYSAAQWDLLGHYKPA